MLLVINWSLYRMPGQYRKTIAQKCRAILHNARAMYVIHTSIIYYNNENVFGANHYIFQRNTK